MKTLRWKIFSPSEKIPVNLLKYSNRFSPYLFNLYREYITRVTSLKELNVGVKINGRNFSNPRYLNDITLVAETEKDL